MNIGSVKVEGTINTIYAIRGNIKLRVIELTKMGNPKRIKESLCR